MVIYGNYCYGVHCCSFCHLFTLNEVSRFIIALILLCVSLAGSAKETDDSQAEIKVGYRYEQIIDGQMRKDDYILLCGKTCSVFYNPTTLWLDQISKDDAARQAYGAMASQMQQSGKGDAVPNRTASIYVFKDFDSETKRVYDDYSDQFVVYTEPFDEMDWEIVPDSTAIVLGYECIMASSTYHGRDWTVWFSPEIPSTDGPWKFAGLPGLILKATESASQHSFTANGIETTDEIIPEMPREDWYHKEDRKKYLKGQFKHLQDPLADIAGGNLPMNARVVVNGKETTREELQKAGRKVLESGYDYLETDYHE